MSPSETRLKLKRRADFYNRMIRAIDGERFSWTLGERRFYEQWLSEIGLSLRTKSWIERNGYKLKRGAEPVGEMYFGSPISRHADVYIVEMQCNKI